METLVKILVFLAAVLGNCWFWTSYTNRLYSLPLHSDRLDRWRIFHDLGLMLMPVWLLITIWDFPTSESQLRFSGVVTNATKWFGVIPWGVSLCGLVMLMVTQMHRVIRKRPPGYRLLNREVFNTQDAIGRPAIGEGDYQKLVSIPGNQAFSPEFNEKTFSFETLPAAFDGLRILHLSDVHFLGTIALPFYEVVFQKAAEWKPDLIVFTGDLLDRPEKLNWIDSTFGKLQAPLGCFYILGNHDWHLDRKPIHERMAECGWQLCHEKPISIEKGSDRLWLAGDERPWMGGTPDFTNADGFRMLLSHTPDNIPTARQQQVSLMLSGHNHGGQIKLPLLGPVYAPSRYGVRYADGVFHEAPTTLHVSRGISGKHPLRIRCRPEISMLTLRSDSQLRSPQS